MLLLFVSGVVVVEMACILEVALSRLVPSFPISHEHDPPRVAALYTLTLLSHSHTE